MRSSQYRTICALAVIALCAGCRKPSAENGAVLFRKNCGGCRTSQPGQVKAAPVLDGYFKRSPRPSLRQTKRTIRDGGRFMPPFRNRLSSDQVDDLIAYLKSCP
ncbi:cytochrome c [Acidobacterium sp. S8]|uniref:c-type cytochrome n=1 Tax=Acidobacterium sp. S8 TaxID=1641854 RepID=UPI00352CC7F9